MYEHLYFQTKFNLVYNAKCRNTAVDSLKMLRYNRHEKLCTSDEGH